ncbi:hypothetical protein Hc94105_0672 [Helicobacter cinaedi]|uniref:hypothetical protein n=1 Tax=Helicobacter cinaedi TaxID=213 RepID=UPI001F3C89A7|nr:hypothetical protein [Helicobacter cinaedi]BDB66477.1 hypothetical protein Hc94105_0672 [Helicobacter cinaedi]
MKAFAGILSNISNKPIQTNLTNHKTLLSFGYLWEKIDTDSKLFILHPLPLLENNEQITHFARYEVGTEFGVAWLLAHTLLSVFQPNGIDSALTSKLDDMLDKLDVGFLSSESNLAEEELEKLKIFLNPSSFALVLGSELAQHPNAKDIAHILGLLSKLTNIEIIMPELIDSISPSQSVEISLSPCEQLPESNGNFIYIMPKCDYASTIDSPLLKAPPLFAPAFKLQDKTSITLGFESQQILTQCQYDSSLKGTIALLYLPDVSHINLGYPYKKVEVIL